MTYSAGYLTGLYQHSTYLQSRQKAGGGENGDDKGAHSFCQAPAPGLLQVVKEYPLRLLLTYGRGGDEGCHISWRVDTRDECGLRNPESTET